jgi:hypothetical protein
MTRDDFIYLLGLIMLTAGAGLVYLPACLLVAGAGFIFYSIFISPPEEGEPTGDQP